MHAQRMHTGSQAIAAINAICLIRQFYYTAVTFITNLSFCMIRLEKCLKMTYLSWIHTAEVLHRLYVKNHLTSTGLKKKKTTTPSKLNAGIQIGNVKCCSNKNKIKWNSIKSRSVQAKFEMLFAQTQPQYAVKSNI